MFYQNMPLYLKLIGLLKIEYEVVHNLPKEYKFSLGEDIIKKTWEIIDLFIKVQMQVAQHENKIEIINDIIYIFENLKLRIRFLSELKLISSTKSGQFVESIVEIGKMLGSWKKHV